MLFGKIKQAEVANLHIELSLHGLFQEKPSPPETRMDRGHWNFIGQCNRGFTERKYGFISVRNRGTFVELTVSNPAPPLSNTEFMALFGKGVTTKANRDGHGFGLYNILRMTERYHGKILTRNESI